MVKRRQRRVGGCESRIAEECGWLRRGMQSASLKLLLGGGFQSVALIDLFPQLLRDIKSNCDSD